MTENINFCSPLLQRLKKIQTNQERCKLASNDLLSKLKESSNYAFQSSNVSQTSEEITLNDDVIMSNTSSYRDNLLQTEERSFIDEGNSKNYLIHDAKIDSLNYIKENLNFDEQENINPNREVISRGPKFPYLKKGSGLCRFKSKTLRGFRKKDSPDKALKTSSDVTKFSGPQVLQIIEDKNGRQNNFEKLEQIINNESFCSTSSKVLELLQDDSSSTACSTPLSTKLSFMGTPVFNNKQRLLSTERGFQLIGNTSPVRELFPPGIVSSNLRNKPQMRIQIQKTRDPNLDSYDKNVQPFEIRNKYSGILKKGEQNLTPSPSLLKVQFLEQGVKVLEYVDDDESLNRTDYSDDTTDLISVSDLENLALLNFNVNVIHEESSSVDISKKHENYAANNASTDCNGAISFSQTSNSLSKLQHKSISKDFISDSKLKHQSADETLDMQMHKMLLLSKVNDLVKEIDIFKNKNKVMEELILELKNEKQKLVDNQNKQVNLYNNNNSKPKLKSKNSLQDKALLEEVSGQIQELNKKLSGLETENNNLKRKVVCLERREKDLRKKQNEELNKELRKDMETVCPKARNEKLEEKFKRPLHLVNAKQLNTFKTKTIKHNIEDDKCICKQNQNKNMDREMSPLKKIHEVKCLQEVINSSSDNKYNRLDILGNKCEEIIYEKRYENEVHTKENTSEKLDENVTSDSQDNKAALFTIPEESMTSSFRRNSSVSESDVPKAFLKLSIDGSKGTEATKASSQFMQPTSVLKPFSVPDQSVEIIDVVGITSTLSTSLSEVDKVEEIINVVMYPNGDKEIIYPSKKVYHYMFNNCVHTVFNSDEREEMRFTNGQREIYYKDGTYQILFPNQSSKSLTNDGTEIIVCSDGTEIHVYKNGLKTIHFPNGQKEFHETDCIRRIYPDGTTKILFKDGRQETRYRNGKIRLKDGQGNVTMR